LTAAVVVNYRTGKNPKTGEERLEPIPDNELRQIENLVREAMGYNGERGDSLSVANAPFTPEVSKAEAVVFWKEPENVTLGLQIMQYLLIAGVIFAIYFMMIRPTLRVMFPPPPKPVVQTAEAAEWGGDADEGATHMGVDSFAAKIEKVRGIAATDPKIVANMLNDWLGVNTQ
jgi:flagellar M-ring protein FliF